MINSMTGFGKGEVLTPLCRVCVEINSVNRKQLELRWNLPREFSAFESDLRNVAAASLSRGAVNAKLNAELFADSSDCKINSALLNKLIENALDAKRQYDLPGAINIAALTPVPGVVTVQAADAHEDELRKAAIAATEQAVNNLMQMRAAEGEALKKDLENRMATLEKLLTQIKPLTAAVPAQLKQKLLEKIQQENIPVDMNDDRLLKEVLFYADKADTTEEEIRLQSHFTQFYSFLSSKDPVGRSLDFLLQEMFREITTLANKAAAPNITPLTVAFKSELEKIREQVQNIE